MLNLCFLTEDGSCPLDPECVIGKTCIDAFIKLDQPYNEDN